MSSTSPGNNVTSDSSEISRGPRIAFLLIFMLMTSVGSLFIFISIIQHRRHKSAQNALIANICVASLIDCSLNMLLVLGALITDEWIYGEFMCKVNTTLMNFVASELMLMMMSLSIDRYLALRFYLKYEAWLKPYRLFLFLAITWIHAMAFSFPFLTDIVTSTFHSQLHLCSATEGTATAFLWSTLLASFFFPFIVTIVFHILIIHLSCRLRANKRAEDTQRTYTEVGKESSCPSIAVSHPSCYTRILFIIWIVLVVPSIITSYVKHFGDENQTDSFPWEADAVFLWLRFFFPAIFPFVTFYCKKEIWQTTKECILCHKNNSVIDMEVVGVPSVTSLKPEKPQPSFEESPNNKMKDKDKEKEKVDATNNALTFNVPVLFATSTGICIEDPSPDEAYEPQHLSERDEVKPFKGKKLDISYDHVWPEELVGDTSDYDSSFEVDQYSTSQPVSTRNVHGSFHRTRSLSDPEITKYVSPRKGKAPAVSGTSRTDSGLDLTGTAGSHADRIIKMHLKQDVKRDSVTARENAEELKQYSTNDNESAMVPVNEHKTNCDKKISSERSQADPGEGSDGGEVHKLWNIRNKPLPPRLEPIQDKVTGNKSKRKKHKTKYNNETFTISDNDPRKDNVQKDAALSDNSAKISVSGSSTKEIPEITQNDLSTNTS